jgi:hypothetical protein
MHQDQAEIVALQALEWLAGDPELFGIFLAASGTDQNGVNARAGDPAFLGGVLDFVLQADAHVLSFAQTVAIDPMLVRAARIALPGGAKPGMDLRR